MGAVCTKSSAAVDGPAGWRRSETKVDLSKHIARLSGVDEAVDVRDLSNRAEPPGLAGGHFVAGQGGADDRKTPPPPEVTVDGLTLEESCLRRLEPGIDERRLDELIYKRFGRICTVAVVAARYAKRDVLSCRVLQLQLAELIDMVLQPPATPAAGKPPARVLVKLVGQVALVIFDRSSDAVNACLSLWHYFRKFNVGKKWKEQVKFTAGLNRGRVLTHSDPASNRVVDASGDPVRLASRLSDDLGPEDVEGGLRLTPNVLTDCDAELRAQLKTEPRRIEGISLECVGVTSYTGVSLLATKEQIGKRLAAKLASSVDVHQTSVSDLCSRTLLPGAEVEDVRDAIDARSHARVSLLLVDLTPAARKSAAQSGTVHLLAMAARCRLLLRPAIEAHGGDLVRTGSEGLAALFPDAVKLLQAAVACRTALRDYNASPDGHFKLDVRLCAGLCDVLPLGPNALAAKAASGWAKLRMAGKAAAFASRAKAAVETKEQKPKPKGSELYQQLIKTQEQLKWAEEVAKQKQALDNKGLAMDGTRRPSVAEAESAAAAAVDSPPPPAEVKLDELDSLKDIPRLLHGDAHDATLRLAESDADPNLVVVLPVLRDLALAAGVPADSFEALAVTLPPAPVAAAPPISISPPAADSSTSKAADAYCFVAATVEAAPQPHPDEVVAIGGGGGGGLSADDDTLYSALGAVRRLSNSVSGAASVIEPRAPT